MIYDVYHLNIEICFNIDSSGPAGGAVAARGEETGYFNGESEGAFNNKHSR